MATDTPIAIKILAKVDNISPEIPTVLTAIYPPYCPIIRVSKTQTIMYKTISPTAGNAMESTLLTSFLFNI